MFAKFQARLRAQPLIKNFLAASGGNVIYFGAQMVRNLFLANLLGPAGFGAWNLGLVLLSYGQWSQLTILNSFRLEGPRCRGRGDLEKLEMLRRLTWTACIVPALFLCLLVALSTCWLADPGVRQAVWMLATLLVTFQLFNYVFAELNLEERFVISSKMKSGFAVANMILTLVLAYAWGFGGAVLAQLISYWLLFFFYRQEFSLVQAPLFNWAFFRDQFKIGFPVGLNGVIYGFFITIDQTVIASTLGVAVLGQYALTAMARSSIGLIPGAIGEVLYMRTSNEYGRTGQVGAVLPLIMKADIYQAYLVAPLIGLAIICAPVLIKLILPAYQSGVAPLQIFLLGLFFTFPVNTGVLMTAVGLAHKLMVYYTVATILQAVLVLAGAHWWSLVGVALSTVVTGVVLFVLINVCGLTRLGVDRARVVAHLLWCTLPIGGVLLGLGVGWLVVSKGNNLSPAFLREVLWMAIFLMLNIPLLVWGVRRAVSWESQAQDF
jgi:O-antigen/teichoic acid export membrane protein